MCGLFASIGFAPDPARLDIVAHRGPDGRGWRVFATEAGPVALGHRRLSIIDKSDAGLQPMADASGRFHLVFNGEIYNYRELREELRAHGAVFTTATDTEVLLRAYQVWGEAALERLRGMFAFVIFDAHEGVVFAARDRFGIKPLYLLIGASEMALASEIKQLLGLRRGGDGVNAARVHDFLTAGISDHTAQTMFDGITQLRGGESVRVSTRTGSDLRPAIRRWYAIPAPDTARWTEKAAAERFETLLSEAVRLHLRADVQVGSCLSGGLDSSSIVCLMADQMALAGNAGAVHTVSACYDEKSVDERPFMEAVVERTSAAPHYIYPRADDVWELASKITWHQDEPFGSTSIVAQWLVFQEAQRVGNKVMLDGQGADEQLGGYHWLYPTYLAGLLRRGRMAMAARTIAERRRFHGASVTRQGAALAAHLLPVGVKKLVRGARRSSGAWFSKAYLAAHGSAQDAQQIAMAQLGLGSRGDIASMCTLMTHASNLQMLLHWEDRNSMAHSVEARVPFLDHPLVEFSLGLGNDHKIVAADTKRVLRRAMTNVLPEAVRERRDKLGFATPEHTWFRGPLRDMLTNGVETTLRRFPTWFDAAKVRSSAREMLADHRRPIEPMLWRIVSLGIWAEVFSLTA